MSLIPSTDVLPTVGALEGTLLRSDPASRVEVAVYHPSSLVCHVCRRPLARPPPAFRHPKHATFRRPPASPLTARQHGRLLILSFNGKGTTLATVCMLKDGESREVFLSGRVISRPSSTLRGHLYGDRDCRRVVHRASD